MMTDKPKRTRLSLNKTLTEHFLTEEARKQSRQATIDTMMDEANEWIAGG